MVRQRGIAQIFRIGAHVHRCRVTSQDAETVDHGGIARAAPCNAAFAFAEHSAIDSDGKRRTSGANAPGKVKLRTNVTTMVADLAGGVVMERSAERCRQRPWGDDASARIEAALGGTDALFRLLSSPNGKTRRTVGTAYCWARTDEKALRFSGWSESANTSCCGLIASRPQARTASQPTPKIHLFCQP
jgi:hypothetical protein